MADWENVANVNFRPRNGDDNYLYIQDSDVNSSQVGMVGGGQVVNIYNWGSNFIIVHELGHALGYWHEHQRASRDSYVQIRWGLVEEGTGHNFVIVPEAREYGPYDFDSVMHYGECAFSICEQQCDNFPDSCRTIQVLPPNGGWQDLIGQRDHLSTMDALIMSFLYPEGDWRFADAAHVGNGVGTFIDPYQEFDVGASGTPVNGTLWIQPGTYNAIQGTYSRAMTIRAPLGAVVLQ